MAQDKIDLLGVQVSNTSYSEARDLIRSWWAEPRKRYIVTPNPEFIVYAQKNSQFLSIINHADLAIPDGVGLSWAGKYLKKPFRERVTGTDLAEKLIEMAANEGKTVFFLGGRHETGARAAEIFKSKYPKLKIGGVFEGDSSQVGDEEIRAVVNRGQIDLLLVAFGHPRQEFWINRNLEFVDAKVLVGVGGAFDYWSGLIPRAPRVFRQLGLEWAFRLLRQPWRAKRQLALVEFILLIFKAKLSI